MPTARRHAAAQLLAAGGGHLLICHIAAFQSSHWRHEWLPMLHTRQLRMCAPVQQCRAHDRLHLCDTLLHWWQEREATGEQLDGEQQKKVSRLQALRRQLAALEAADGNGSDVAVKAELQL
jgi:alkylhydroperoxidase family enzyme